MQQQVSSIQEETKQALWVPGQKVRFASVPAYAYKIKKVTLPSDDAVANLAHQVTHIFTGSKGWVSSFGLKNSAGVYGEHKAYYYEIDNEYELPKDKKLRRIDVIFSSPYDGDSCVIGGYIFNFDDGTSKKLGDVHMKNKRMDSLTLADNEHLTGAIVEGGECVFAITWLTARWQ